MFFFVAALIIEDFFQKVKRFFQKVKEKNACVLRVLRVVRVLRVLLYIYYLFYGMFGLKKIFLKESFYQLVYFYCG